jgi:pyruvate dehydrogenase E2 component (dihydrolipoamide acetyltransferase)
MPILGADMEAGTLVAWRKRPGDRVQRGEIVAEVETEKGLIEVEIFVTGVLERILVEPGRTVPVGTVLAMIREDGAPAVAAPTTAPPPPTAPPPVTPPVAAPRAVPARERLRISPAARALAARLGVDPGTLRGTGPDGAITLEDVERAAPGPRPPAPDRQAQLRQTIATAMARAKREIPHYYLATTIDLHPALAWLAAENARRPVPERVLCAAVLLRAVALALREVPELNGVWAGDRVVPSPAVHLGVAISLRDGGLVAPALHDADRLSLEDLMRQLRDLVRRARAGRLRSSELSDPTITVTNLGEQGIDSVFGIIYPPQVAIVGFGRVVERPWSVAGQIVSRPVVTASLSADHRVTDGHRGARFLAALERLLQEPARL